MLSQRVLKVCYSSVEKGQKFFSFEWLDIDALVEPIQPMITFFTETIPNAFNGFIDGLAGCCSCRYKLPEQFVGIVDNIVNGFLGFFGLGPENTQDFEPPTEKTPISPRQWVFE